MSIKTRLGLDQGYSRKQLITAAKAAATALFIIAVALLAHS